MPPLYQMIIHVSEGLRALGRWLPGVQIMADSVYVHAVKNQPLSS